MFFKYKVIIPIGARISNIECAEITSAGLGACNSCIVLTNPVVGFINWYGLSKELICVGAMKTANIAPRIISVIGNSILIFWLFFVFGILFKAFNNKSNAVIGIIISGI